MSIIIRLQNLPLSASSLDIRRFFTGLLIPDGGVHIIGGPDKVAFIAFSTDEDARQAMARQHEALIKDTKIQLFLSSRSEMKQVIDKARSQNLSKVSASSSAPSSAAANHPQQQQPQQSTSQPSTLGNASIRSTEDDNHRQKTDNVLTIRSNFRSIHRQPEHNATSTKLNQQSIGQMNYGAISAPAGNIANLVANLQESTDYRRHRSRSPADGRYPTSERLLREQSDPNVQRVKQMMEQARQMENSRVSPGGSVRARLGGFDLPAASNGNSNYPPHLAMNRWNGQGGPGMNGNAPLMNGGNAAYDHTQAGSAALLMTPQTQNNSSSRFVNANHSYYTDNQSISLGHHPLNGNGMLPMQHPPPNRFIIELKGLPKNVQTVDIQSFFRPVGIQVSRDQIKLSMDERGDFHGTAHLIMHSQKDAETALFLSGRSIGNERIQVLPVHEGGPLLHTPLDYPPPNGNLDLLHQPPNYPHGARPQESYSRRKEMYPIFMKGLPYPSCNKAAVEKFFYPIPLFEVVIITERSGRPTGNAYVIVETKENYELAKSRHMNYMDSRYIELFSVPMEDVENYLQRLEYRQQLSSMGISHNHPNYPDSPEQPTYRKRKRFDSGPTYCVQIRGLPPQVNNQDLTDYFLEHGATAHAVHISLKQNGRNAGECFVEFRDFNSLTKALKLDEQWMNDSRLSIREIPYAKVCEIVGLKPPMDSGYAPKMFKPNKEHSQYDEKRCTIVAKVSTKATKSDLCEFFRDFNVNQSQIEWRLDRNGEKADEVLVRFRTENAAKRAIQKLDKKYFIDRSINLRPL